MPHVVYLFFVLCFSSSDQLQSCPNPGQPLNGRLVAPLGFEVGSKVYFIPRDGYKSATPGAALVSECGRNGIWSEPTPKFVDLGQPGMLCVCMVCGGVLLCEGKSSVCILL